MVRVFSKNLGEMQRNEVMADDKTSRNNSDGITNDDTVGYVLSINTSEPIKTFRPILTPLSLWIRTRHAGYMGRYRAAECKSLFITERIAPKPVNSDSSGICPMTCLLSDLFGISLTTELLAQFDEPVCCMVPVKNRFNCIFCLQTYRI